MFAFGILQIQLQNPLDNKLNFTVKLLSTYFAVVDQFATLNMSCLLTSPLSLTWQRKWGSPQRWHDALGANSILAHHQLWWCMESWYLLSWDSSWWAWSRSGVILPSSLFETFLFLLCLFLQKNAFLILLRIFCNLYVLMQFWEQEKVIKCTQCHHFHHQHHYQQPTKWCLCSKTQPFNPIPQGISNTWVQLRNTK